MESHLIHYKCETFIISSMFIIRSFLMKISRWVVMRTIGELKRYKIQSDVIINNTKVSFLVAASSLRSLGTSSCQIVGEFRQ